MIPVPALVVLIGAAGSGKSTLAARLFEPGDILSSDALRETLSGDPADQRSTRTVFGIVHREVTRRLGAGRLVVVDATNVERSARLSLVRLARAAGAPSIAIVLALPAAEVHARNAGRPGRVVPTDIVDRHLERLRRLGSDPAAVRSILLAEGFASAHVVSSVVELENLVGTFRGARSRSVLAGIAGDPSAAAILDDLLAELESVLGPWMVGAYLSGSAVTGGYDPGVSDLDLVVLTDAPVDELRMGRLDDVHRLVKSRNPGWDDRLEIVYISQATLGSFRTSPDRLAVISPGETFHLRADRAVEWLQNWFLLRESGVTLRGPAPTAIVPPITHIEFVAATARYARHLAASLVPGASAGSTAYTILTMCRAAMTIVVGRAGSKQAAAAWAAEAQPEFASVIDAALRCRRSGGTTGSDDVLERDTAMALVRHLATLIDQSEESAVSPP